MNQIERTIVYYRIGKLISQTLTRYKRQQYKIKEELTTSLGIQVGEKPFKIAKNYLMMKLRFNNSKIL